VTNPPQADKTTWKVLSPPPVLTPIDADALLANWRGAQSVVDIRPLEGGIMNWNYRIGLSGSTERFVLRFYDRMPTSCSKEVQVLGLVADALPVPNVLMAAPAGAAGYPPFCILEFIDGISLRELRRRGDTEGVADACYDAGRLLPRLTRHRFDRAGVLSLALEVEDGPFAGASVGDVVDHFAASPLFCRRTDAT